MSTKNGRGLILSRNLGLYRCHRAFFIVPSTLPTAAFFGLQADEAEFFTAAAAHVFTSPHMLNYHATRHTCATGGASRHSNDYFPGAISKDS